MAGRKRKPRYMHLVQGTAQPCRMKDEPKAPPSAPNPAIEISSRASFWFGVLCTRLQALKIGSAVDSETVMLCAVRLAEIEECNADIQAYGRVTFKIETIMVPGPDDKLVMKAQKILKSNPAVTQRSEALRHAQSLLAEFGLSPASRGKIDLADQPEDLNPWMLLAND